MGINNLRSGGRVDVSEESVAISIVYFIIGAVILVLKMPLSLPTGAEGLIESDRLLEYARSVNAGGSFLHTPLEYCPTACGWF